MFVFIHDDITAGGKLMRSAKSTGWAGEMPNILKYVRTPGSWSQNSYDTSSMTSTSMLAGYTSVSAWEDCSYFRVILDFEERYCTADFCLISGNKAKDVITEYHYVNISL